MAGPGTGRLLPRNKNASARHRGTAGTGLLAAGAGWRLAAARFNHLGGGMGSTNLLGRATTSSRVKDGEFPRASSHPAITGGPHVARQIFILVRK